MFYWGILILELLFLFFSSRFIFQAFFFFSYKIFRSEKLAIIPIFIFFLPGTVIHELAHYLAAEILLVGAQDLEIAPKLENKHLRMGSVQIKKTDIFRNFLIGVAPLFAGSAIIFAAFVYFTSNIHLNELFSSPFNIASTLILIWVVFFITNTMFSSKKDMEGSFVLAGIIVFASITLSFISMISKVDVYKPILDSLQNTRVIEGVRILSFIFMVPVAINGLVFCAARVLLKRI